MDIKELTDYLDYVHLKCLEPWETEKRTLEIAELVKQSHKLTQYLRNIDK